jgi:hypothetical protein
MRVLLATAIAPTAAPPPCLGEEQVNCGPDWPNDIAPDGRVRSLPTPAGKYDLAAVAAQLPSEQRPEVVVAMVDASWRNLPGNLAGFKCPKVLVVADTHHLQSPLIGMLRYATSERFDRVVFLNNRHHAAFFRAAGFRNLHWLPLLTFPHADAAVQSARQAARPQRIAMVATPGRDQARSNRLFDGLAARGLPAERQVLASPGGLKFYGSSSIGFHVSLNGELSQEVFEILSAGAALLTDRLAPGSGLERILADRRDLLVFGTPDELAERAAQAVSQPAETQAIGAAGARWFDLHCGEARRRADFEQVVCGGKAPELFAWSEAEQSRVLFAGKTDRLVQSLLVYENLQDLHRTQETVHVVLGQGTPPDLAAMYATLPRVEVAAAINGTAPDWMVVEAARCEATAVPPATRLWCWDAPAGATPTPLDAQLAAAGLARLSTDVAVYGRAAAPAAAVPTALGPIPQRALKPRPVKRRICITFGGEVYDGTTALTAMLAPKLGADEVWVYDDHWLVQQRSEFRELNHWLWDHHHKRGFGWYAWKPFILIDALDKLADGDVVLYIDADTFPIDDFSVLYETCARDGGIMLFKAGGNVNQRFKQSQWCKRDCYLVMNQDDPRYYEAEAGVARFMLFQKGPWRARQFLMEWLTYCVNSLATTFDPSQLAKEVPGFVEHRTEQAIMTNLAHKYGLRLYREACELGNAFPEDQQLYPQLFSQLNPWGQKTAPCVGSKFRNVT